MNNYRANVHTRMASEHTPSANGVTNTKLWKFKVKYEPKDAEKLCITGDCNLLGNWKEGHVIPLSYDE